MQSARRIEARAHGIASASGEADRTAYAAEARRRKADMTTAPTTGPMRIVTSEKRASTETPVAASTVAEIARRHYLQEGCASGRASPSVLVTEWCCARRTHAGVREYPSGSVLGMPFHIAENERIGKVAISIRPKPFLNRRFRFGLKRRPTLLICSNLSSFRWRRTTLL